jgi:hypothetical protein
MGFGFPLPTLPQLCKGVGPVRESIPMIETLNGTGATRSPASPLWAITAYFNPFGIGHRRATFRRFRHHLGVPLLAVELGFDDRFDLGPEDAEILIRVRGGSVLWQKERLLNLAVQALPAHVEGVVWTDSDVVFLRKDWATAVQRQLQHFAMVQPFRRLYYLDEGQAPEDFQPVAERAFDSVAYRYANGCFPDRAYRTHGLSQTLRYAPGMAWAARRSTLESCRLYDAAILGCGDKLAFSAAVGRADDAAFSTRMGEAQTRHYREWADRFRSAVQGQISYVGGDLLHLWHGALEDRRYRERLDGFDQFDFDPRIDLTTTPDGAWRWNSDKPDLHKFVLNQMKSMQPFRSPSTESGEWVEHGRADAS